MTKDEARLWLKGRKFTIVENERMLDNRWSVRTTIEKYLIIGAAIGLLSLLYAMSTGKVKPDPFIFMFFPIQIGLMQLLKPYKRRCVVKEWADYYEFKKYHKL